MICLRASCLKATSNEDALERSLDIVLVAQECIGHIVYRLYSEAYADHQIFSLLLGLRSFGFELLECSTAR